MKIAPSQIENYIKRIADEKIIGCLIFGPDTSLVKYRFDAIAKQITPDLSDPFLVTNLSKERLAEDHALLSDEFFSISMLGGRKLILVRDADANTADALKLLLREKHVSGNSDNFILIQGGDLDKNSALRKLAEASNDVAAIACYEDSEYVVKNFIESELRNKKISFDSATTNALFTRIGSNRQMALSEIEKIDLYFGDGEKNLTVELVALLNGMRGEVEVGQFIASYSNQKFDTALVQAKRLLEDGMEPIALLRFLGNHLQKLYQAKKEIESGRSLDEAVKAQRLFFKAEADFRKALASNSSASLNYSLNAVEEIEIAIKSGKSAPKILLTNFILENLAQKTRFLTEKNFRNF